MENQVKTKQHKACEKTHPYYAASALSEPMSLAVLKLPRSLIFFITPHPNNPEQGMLRRTRL